MEKFRRKRIWPKFDGSRITEYRRRHNLTMQEFAEKLGVHLACICDWETRGVCPRRETLEKLEEVLRKEER